MRELREYAQRALLKGARAVILSAIISFMLVRKKYIASWPQSISISLGVGL